MLRLWVIYGYGHLVAPVYLKVESVEAENWSETMSEPRLPLVSKEFGCRSVSFLGLISGFPLALKAMLWHVSDLPQIHWCYAVLPRLIPQCVKLSLS